ncbi:hypothetical protein IWW34DRAFT_774240 [Fusarium oxysporum f. sp. albedinis]|nr:hypothetical protein IWW34DRAFT_774240 [Fusarium oxysporum f. sp. albedinis]KAI8397341.1 hypothetical protein FOFC_20613 [Fusarium oxysporum]KAJ0133506.1 Uncharacterized protein HZ326_23428 [Fusarium oxysporum f. sp. albedinis]KAJ0138464.1 hypothetical protein HZ326_18582 [Fusarium oxysporum f. sp. albedinis]
MCYFDRVVWACGNWRWDKFRQQCNKEYRIGETCGLKLVYERRDEEKKCKICDQVTKKENRIRRTTERMARLREWKLLASLEKCEEEVDSLKNEILRLRQQHSASMPGGGVYRLQSSNTFELHASIDGPFARPSIPVGLTERQDDLSSTMLLGIYAARRRTRPKDGSNHLSHVSITSAGIKKHGKTLA